MTSTRPAENPKGNKSLGEKNSTDVTTNFSPRDQFEIHSSAVELLYKTTSHKSFFGMEPSGKLHLGHYLILNAVKQLSKKNVLPLIYLADYHARLNDKIRVDHFCAKTKQFMQRYFEEDCLIVVSSDMIRDPAYSAVFQEFAERVTLNSVIKSLPEDLKLQHKKTLEKGHSMRFKHLLYVIYQAVDPHYFGCDTVFCGTDQRKIYTLAYDIYEKLDWAKFNLILYPLLTRSFELGKYERKMSSSGGKSIYLDSLLYETLDRYLKNELLTEREQSIITQLKTCEDPEVLALYNVRSNHEFLIKLHEDTFCLKNFSWQ